MQGKKISSLLKTSDIDLEFKKQKYWNELWGMFVEEQTQDYGNLTTKEGLTRLVSYANFKERGKASNANEVGVWIRLGDICYVDYGVNYINEAAYQHFGLILAIVNNKILVVPMTSNKRTCKEAIGTANKNHLMFLGKVDGLHKYSTLFLNDAKFINSARVIDVKGNISPDSILFQQIKARYHEIVGK